MMPMNEKKVPIKITIAGFAMQLEVSIGEQDLIREAEKRVNSIFSDWEKKYPHKSAAQLLAMLTFRFASFYYASCERERSLAMQVDSLAGEINSVVNS